MLFSISPGLIGLIPGLKLSGWLLVAPLLNIALLSRDLLQGQAEPAAAVIVVLSTVLFAVAAIGVAARIFGTDAVLYEAQATWSDLWRRSVKGSAVPSLPGAMLCLAFLFPAFFLLSNSVALLAGENLPLRLAALSAATAVVFALLPGLAAWWGRVRFDTAFRFQTPPWLSLPAAVLLGLSLWPFAHELTLLTRAIGLVTFDEAQLARVQGLLEKLRTVSPAVILFALAAVPACFEELFFRGYLFSALSARLRPRMAILSSALAFGVFHLIAMDSLALERFAPSALMGVALGWVAWRTASVFPGMLVHFCHNGFLMLVAYYKVELAAWGWGVGENEHLPLAWQAAAILGCGVAVALLQISSRKRAGAASPQNFVG
jgi:ABC-2 type transport system permease protein/sodium transport system permease protein